MMGTPDLSRVYIWRLNSISSSTSTFFSRVSRCSRLGSDLLLPRSARVESLISIGVMPVFIS